MQVLIYTSIVFINKSFLNKIKYKTSGFMIEKGIEVLKSFYHKLFIHGYSKNVVTFNW